MAPNDEIGADLTAARAIADNALVKIEYESYRCIDMS